MDGWQKILLIIAGIIFGLFLLGLFGLSIWSFRAERAPANDAFRLGVGPNRLSGVYAGKFSREVSWQGKQFNIDGSGINNFKDGQRYVFKTYNTQSLKGSNKVLRIDYNQPENPWWLRFIVDEVSQVDIGEYQGKVYLKLGPLDFTLTYFQLKALGD